MYDVISPVVLEVFCFESKAKRGQTTDHLSKCLFQQAVSLSRLSALVLSPNSAAAVTDPQAF